jgi:2-polyprenyl-3-methyl-5-hydroxy-6-metoxy-1,4-benzoquinol methylase
MPDFSKRSDQQEILDQPDIPFEDILINMQELNTINSLLGGHRITCNGVNEIISASGRPPQYTWRICEIGCGNGNNITAIHKWCNTNKINAQFIGIDISEACIGAGERSPAAAYTRFIASDFRAVKFDEQPDIIFSSLFCHHFSNSQLHEQLVWLRQHARLGFFINDLHRHPLAFYSIRLLTGIFSNSYLVKHDAPVSVLRGFKRHELLSLLQQAQIDKFSLKWRWAFRWLIVIVN